MLSRVTTMPCAARISSTSRRFRLKTWIEPNRVADDLGREAVTRICEGGGRHPASFAPRGNSGQRRPTWQCRLRRLFLTRHRRAFR
jgi:hypothetical protein